MSISKNLRVIAALGTLSGAVWAGTFAAFTDDAGSSATFTAGTVDLLVGGATNDAHSFAALNVPNMKPKDVQYAALDVKNAGTLPFSYGMAAAATDVEGKPAGLGAALKVAVKSVTAASGCTSDGWASGTEVVAPSAVSATTFTARALASGVTDVLCFQVSFPEGANDNALQGAATSVSFKFAAAQ